MEIDDSDPYIETPDEIDDSLSNGLLCFIDQDRQCGPACMAYTTHLSENPQFNVQQKHCSLLTSIDRVGRYSGVLVQLLKKDKTNAG